jgi:hypothetical protein
LQTALNTVGKLFANTVVFVLAYILLMLPTYYLPYVGSNSAVLAGLGAVTGMGLSPQFWMHLTCLYLLVVITWLRGGQIEKQWITVFPVIASVFDMVPGVNLVPLVPTAMHMCALIFGARGTPQQTDLVSVPMLGGSLATAGAIAGFTWYERYPKPSAAANPATATTSSRPQQNPVSKPIAKAAPQKNPAVDWLGRWEGVEGTSLELSRRTDGDLLVKISSLDGDMSVRGVVKGDVVEIYHLSQPRKIRLGNGEATGLKWLAGKTECLILAEGEGYCRK